MHLKQSNSPPPFSRTQSAMMIALLILMIGVSFSLGFFTRELVVERLGDFSLLNQAYALFQEHAYGVIPENTKLQYGMIRGLLQAYGDPFSSFIEPAQAKLQTNQLEGKFGGIGVRLDKDDSNHILLYPLPNSPAEKAGIKEADRLIAVDQLDISTQISMDELQAAIRGPVGSTVNITIARAPDYQPVKYVINRAEVAAPSVTANLSHANPQVGVIQLTVMAQTSPDEIQKAIQDLTGRGAKYFVLDLRNNGGGLVDAGVNTARLFLDKDSLIIEEQFRGEAVQSFDAPEPGKYLSLPLAILVNKNTASAAEILAGSLQVQGRAKLIGVKTFGKDSVQLVFDLQDNSSLHITSGKWWLPGQQGKLGGNGLQPDITLTEPEANSNAAVDKAIQLLISGQ